MNKCRLCHSYAINPNTKDRKGVNKYKDLCDICFWKVQIHKYDCTKCEYYIGIFTVGFCVKCTNNPTHHNHFQLDKTK